MSAVLLDVNVLLALGWSQHQFSPLAVNWFDSLAGASWATCPFTESGFIRISSQPRFQSGASMRKVVEVLAGLRKGAGHQFWPADLSPAEQTFFPRLQGHGQVTDAYLLALAHRRKGRVATFDAGLKSLARELLGSDKQVLLIEH